MQEPLALGELQRRQLLEIVAVLAEVLLDQQQLELGLEVVNGRDIGNVTHGASSLTA